MEERRMEMNKNLSQLFYIKNNISLNSEEKHGNVRELECFKVSGISSADLKTLFAHPLVTNEFPLTTTYPGLLTGSGYSHPSLHDVKTKKPNDIGDFQLGFFFDHTTGLPVIPGSSVKGILKSVFPQNKFKDNNARENRLKYVQEITEKIKAGSSSLINETNWEKIFFGEPPERKHIFCDAYIESIPQNGRILEDDYITPHHNNIFKEPTPIRFLKIAPGIKITFQFVLHDYPFGADPILKKADIADVFKQIILHFGIGAKRNVGYGQFQ